MTDDRSNIPIPDPSLATNERLAQARVELENRIARNLNEVKGWVDSLQLLIEERIGRAEDKTANLDRVVQTRLAGSETALNAAMAASDKVVARIETGVGSTMNEMKASFSKQMDALNEKIDDLKERMSETGGHRQGISQMITLVIASIGAIAAVVAVIFALSKPAPAQVFQPFHHSNSSPSSVKKIVVSCP